MIVIEDGSIVASSVSYVSAVDATTYHAARGNALWSGADSVKEAALIKAATYLDGKYRKRWKGQKAKPVIQSMEWPRVGVRVVDTPQPYYDVPPSFYDDAYSGFLGITTIPQRLKDAQCEAALLALSAELAPALNSSVRSEKVDILETTYAPGAKAGQVEYQAIDQLLSDYLQPLGNGTVQRG